MTAETFDKRWRSPHRPPTLELRTVLKVRKMNFCVDSVIILFFLIAQLLLKLILEKNKQQFAKRWEDRASPSLSVSLSVRAAHSRWALYCLHYQTTTSPASYADFSNSKGNFFLSCTFAQEGEEGLILTLFWISCRMRSPMIHLDSTLFECCQFKEKMC